MLLSSTRPSARAGYVQDMARRIWKEVRRAARRGAWHDHMGTRGDVYCQGQHMVLLPATWGRRRTYQALHLGNNLVELALRLLVLLDGVLVVSVRM